MLANLGAAISDTPPVKFPLSSPSVISSRCDRRRRRSQCVLGLPTTYTLILGGGAFIAELCAIAVDLANGRFTAG